MVNNSEVTEVQLVSFSVPYFLESREKGAFIDLYRTIEQSISPQIRLTLLPAKRAQLNFELGKADIYFPGLPTSIKGNYLRSDTVFYKEIFAFVRKGDLLPSRPEQLSSLNIGLTSGYNYGEIVPKSNNNIQLAQSDKTNFLKLEAGRIDIFLVERYSGLKALRESQAQNIYYNLNTPLSREPVFFVFQNSDQGRYLQKEFNRVLNELRQKNQLSVLLTGQNSQ